MASQRKPIAREVADFENLAWALLRNQLKKLSNKARETRELLEPQDISTLNTLLTSYERMRREIRDSVKESQKLLKKLDPQTLLALTATWSARRTPADIKSKKQQKLIDRVTPAVKTLVEDLEAHEGSPVMEELDDEDLGIEGYGEENDSDQNDSN